MSETSLTPASGPSAPGSPTPGETEIASLTPNISQNKVDEFALAVVEYGGNVGAAYAEVFGGSAKVGVSRGHLLINTDTRVVARLKQIRESVDDVGVLSRGVHIAELARLRDLAEAQGAVKVAVHCEVKRGEVAGFYDRVIQNRNPSDGPISVTINMGGEAQPRPVTIDV
jgi:phage terminase small subunit